MSGGCRPIAKSGKAAARRLLCALESAMANARGPPKVARLSRFDAVVAEEGRAEGVKISTEV